jgi:hypothetical protein
LIIPSLLESIQGLYTPEVVVLPMGMVINNKRAVIEIVNPFFGNMVSPPLAYVPWLKAYTEYFSSQNYCRQSARAVQLKLP